MDRLEHEPAEKRAIDPANCIAGIPIVLFASLVACRLQCGPTAAWRIPWIPGLGVNFSWRLDGLGLLFASLITGLGTLILVYAVGYMGRHPDRWRLYAWLLAFMAAMLGVVLADNAMLLFVCWELTSITSYMLIGFKHEEESARAAALQAILVTGMGGLALMAGLLMLGRITGTLELSEMVAHGASLRADPLATPCLMLILLGLLTKSAQFPFHFWLPNAMVAPTPVSAYLHSATMVKAGVYLAARLSPLASGIPVWDGTLIASGLATMVLGGLMAVTQVDSKRILAYSTVSCLGMMILLLGFGTPYAAKAAVVLIFCHALYKGGLFMVAGAVDHQLGTRDVRRMSGLATVMPGLAIAGVLLAGSQAGLPPTGGFLSKELAYETALDLTRWAPAFALAILLANAAYVAVAGMVVFGPFFRREPRGAVGVEPSDHGPAAWPLVFPPLVLGLAGVFPTWFGDGLLAPAYASILPEAAPMKLKLWHGFGLPLLLSGVTLGLGIAIFAAARGRRLLSLAVGRLSPVAPTEVYDRLLEGLKWAAARQTDILQSGKLRLYLLIVLSAFIALLAVDLWDHVQVPAIGALLRLESYEMFVPALILGAVVLVLRTSSRLTAVCALGVIGYAIAMLFVMYGAPDLAMTQFSIETLTVVLFVLVLYRLPRFKRLTGPGTRSRDLLVAGCGGAVMAALVLAATAAHAPSRLTSFFADQSLPKAKGRNVVNVILVDFRGLDTLGEIVVLSTAALGVSALMRGSRSRHDAPAIASHSTAGPQADPREPFGIKYRLLVTATTYLLPLLLLFSLFLLFRGHNEPGGGFVGGLTAASACALYAMTFGVGAAKRLLGLPPRVYVAAGLFMAVASGLIACCFGQPYMTGQWSPLVLPAIGKLGTPLLFDVGVFMVVLGMATMIVYELAED